MFHKTQVIGYYFVKNEINSKKTKKMRLLETFHMHMIFAKRPLNINAYIKTFEKGLEHLEMVQISQKKICYQSLEV